MQNFTVKELRDLLVDFPDDMEVQVNVGGTKSTTVDVVTDSWVDPEYGRDCVTEPVDVDVDLDERNVDYDIDTKGNKLIISVDI